MVDGIGTPRQTFSEIARLARKGADSVSAWQRADGSVKLFTLPKMFAKIEHFFMPEAANRRQALAKTTLLNAIEAEYGNAMVDKVLNSFGNSEKPVDSEKSVNILDAGTALSSGMVKDIDDLINNRPTGGPAHRSVPNRPWNDDLASPEHRGTDVQPLNDEIEELKKSSGSKSAAKPAAKRDNDAGPAPNELDEKESNVKIRPSADDDEKVNIVNIGPAVLPLDDEEEAPSLVIGAGGAWVAKPELDKNGDPKLPSPDRVFRDFLKEKKGDLAPLAENSLATLKDRARGAQPARSGAAQNRQTITIQINYSEAGKAIREAFEAKGAAALDGMSEDEIADLAQSAMDKYVQSILDAGGKAKLDPKVLDLVNELLDPKNKRVESLIDQVLEKHARRAKPSDSEERALAKEIKKLEQQFEALKQDVEPLLDDEAIDDLKLVRIDPEPVREKIAKVIKQAGDKLNQATPEELLSLARETVELSLKDAVWSKRQQAADDLPLPPNPAEQQALADSAEKGRAKANALIGEVYVDKIKTSVMYGTILKAARNPDGQDKLGDKGTMPLSASDGGPSWDEALRRIAKVFADYPETAATFSDRDKFNIAVQVVKDYIKADA